MEMVNTGLVSQQYARDKILSLGPAALGDKRVELILRGIGECIQQGMAITEICKQLEDRNLDSYAYTVTTTHLLATDKYLHRITHQPTGEVLEVIAFVSLHAQTLRGGAQSIETQLGPPDHPIDAQALSEADLDAASDAR